MPSSAEPVVVTSPLDCQIRQLDEAATVLDPLRPDLAEVCREAACLLREETEFALWA